MTIKSRTDLPFLMVASPETNRFYWKTLAKKRELNYRRSSTLPGDAIQDGKDDG